MSREFGECCCVATVTDSEYIHGAVALLWSFLRNNAGFRGELVVIHDGLEREARRRLDHFPGLRYHSVGPALKERLRALSAFHPRIVRKLGRFFSLEAFRLDGYEGVLYLDSDVLCTGDARELFQRPGALMACPDQTWFREEARDPRTFVPTPGASGSTTPSSFNTGVLLLRHPVLGRDTHERLLEGLRPDVWSSIRTGHTDQVILNRAFENRWTALPERYNYLVSADSGSFRRSRSPMENAVFLHFLSRPKPWQHWRLAPRGPDDGERRRAFLRWEATFRSHALQRLWSGRDPRPLAELAWRTCVRAARRARRGLLP